MIQQMLWRVALRERAYAAGRDRISGWHILRVTWTCKVLWWLQGWGA